MTENQTRRDILKTILTAATVPLIVSLRPDEARAAGSWSNSKKDHPFQSAEGGRPIPPPRVRYRIPFSNTWRQQRAHDNFLRRSQGRD